MATFEVPYFIIMWLLRPIRPVGEILTLISAINLNSSPGDDKPKSPEPFSSVAVDEIPDVPNNSFLLRRSCTPSPVREKGLQQAKNRYVFSEVQYLSHFHKSWAHSLFGA